MLYDFVTRGKYLVSFASPKHDTREGNLSYDPAVKSRFIQIIGFSSRMNVYDTRIPEPDERADCHRSISPSLQGNDLGSSPKIVPNAG